MATQSLYRRYRPRRFSDLRGQDHVVRALRDAVREGREGQAYLFSGPRGTGKTSSARILAKVLNCVEPVDGEPCCECESCRAVERGTSYDVHELDAASHNGVDNIRELIERSSLGTPGRHKVYILDEVHMLTKAAEAALLKTLEEPPDHVVFVLATTDPQKMSDTVRSRTQHLQFHLLGPDELDQHIRWVAQDAGLDLDDAAFEAVLRRANGSVRDGLSALELLAATGGDTSDQLDLDTLMRALAERDTAAALASVATAIADGHDARTLTESLVRQLRDGFLSLMAPELVQLPQRRIDQVAAMAIELGPAMMVKTIERLGTAMIDMRAAPDPRIMLEVALVQLTHDSGASDLESLSARISRLEDAVRSRPAAATAVTDRTTAPPPVDPVTKRAQLGGRARRQPDASGPIEAPAAATAAPSPTATAPVATTSAAVPDLPPADQPAPAATGDTPVSASVAPAAEAEVPAEAGAPATAEVLDRVPEVWTSQVRSEFKPFVRALYAAGNFSHHDGTAWYFNVPNPVHADKCEKHRPMVEQALSTALGSPIVLVITASGHDHTDPSGMTRRPIPATASDTTADVPSPAAKADQRADQLADEIANRPDPDELTEAPPGSVLSPIDRIAQAFPGAELIDDATETSNAG
jgi:DNA polymerase-3 subunit gamma/tau